MVVTTKSRVEPAALAKSDFHGLSDAALFLSLALVAARCTMVESIRQAMAGGDYPAAPGATTSLVLDLLCWLPAMLVLVRRLIDKSYSLRWPASAMLLVSLVGWMLASVAWADDRFLALISACNALAAFALLWAAIQSVRSWANLRLVAAVAVGLLLVMVAQGYYYKYIEIPETQKLFQEKREQFLREQNWRADDFLARQFNNKLSSGEVMGFTLSPNSFAAVLVLLGVIGAGVVIQRAVDRDNPAWPLGIGLCLAAAAVLLRSTDSKAALVGPILAAATLAATAIFRRQLPRWSVLLFFLGAACLLGMIGGVVIFGLHHGGLPGASLNFRWRYWIAAMRMFRDHLWLGVGWSNFGPHYLQYRLPSASEEIKDPHNCLIRCLVELGIPGGVLVLAWLGSLWWELTRPRFPEAAAGRQERGLWLRLGLPTAAMFINALASIDFSQSADYALVEVVRRVVWLGIMALGMSAALIRNGQRPDIDDRPAPWLLYAILVALAVFLIHNLIEFSLFESGIMCLVMLLAGAALAIRQAPVAVRRRHVAFTAAALAGLLALSVIGAGLTVLVEQAEADAQRGEMALGREQFTAAADAYGQAERTLGINGDYALKAGDALVFQPQRSGRPGQVGKAWLQRAKGYYDLAIKADPSNVDAYRRRAELAWTMHDKAAMIADYDQAVRLDPNSVSLHLEYGLALASAGDRAAARGEYQAALRYNDLLEKEDPKRLGAEQIGTIRNKIELLK